VRHTDWDELEAPVRLAIEARTGRARAVRTVNAGLNSQLAVVLDTSTGWVFVKGLRADHPGVVRQGREAMINPYVRAVAPRLRWHDQVAGWDLLAFEYIDGARHADYRPGSPDLPVKQARQRWAAYVDREADLGLLDGDALLHTDFNPLNILLGPDRLWIIDWAWPTRGAAFIDAACFLIRAMAAGHSASQAEALAARCPGWQQAPSAAIDVFALASARLYDEIARQDPQPFKQRLASVTGVWFRHRLDAGIIPVTRKAGLPTPDGEPSRREPDARPTAAYRVRTRTIHRVSP
jgi:hypothetical protein